jgi:hypothetical protein
MTRTTSPASQDAIAKAIEQLLGLSYYTDPAYISPEDQTRIGEAKALLGAIIDCEGCAGDRYCRWSCKAEVLDNEPEKITNPTLGSLDAWQYADSDGLSHDD